MASNRHHCLLIILQLILPVVLSESFRDSPASLTVLTHTPLNLSCYAPDPSPPPSVLWLVNGVVFQANDSRRTALYDSATGRSTYQIGEVEYSDAGGYQCQAAGETGTALFQSDMGTLTVQGQPSFRRPLMPVVAPAGSQAVFQCHVVSNPPATISWTHGSTQRNLTSGGRIFLNSSALVISNVQSSDEGFYHCIAQNSFGVNSTSAELTIGEPPPPLQVTISPSGDPLQRTEGSDVTLHCEVGGGGSVDTLRWLHNGVEVTEQLTRESNGLALSLEHLTEEDGGEYSCEAIAGSSTITQHIQLEILIPPSVELIPSTSTVVVVDHTLDPIPRCNAGGVPPPTISWFNPSGEPLGVEEGAPVLGARLTRSDSGDYECVATNSAGEDRTQLSLVVEDAPLISDAPSDTLAAYGSDVILPCSAEGPPSPTVSWSRADGAPLGNSTLEVSGALHLFSVAMEDSGVYICEASNGYEPPATVSVTLTVLSPPRVASLTVSPSSPLLSGTTFSILCSVPDPPAPFSIHWYWNGTLVPTADLRIQIETGQESGTLTVFNADQRYSALYTCNVTTGYAFDTAQATVIIGSAPVIVRGPSDTDLEPGQGASIDCAVTGLPDPRIEWFVTYEGGGDRRQLVTTVGEHHVIHTDSLELVNTTQQESGVYECVAENELGRDTRSAQVRVEGAPMALSLSPTVLIADDNFTLTCDIIHNFPTATVTWRRRGDSAPLPEERFRTTLAGVLEITPVVPADAGGYECEASNRYGASAVSAGVIVHVRPTVTLLSPSLTAILFDDVTLSCSVAGNPAPSQEWSRTDRVPLSGSRYVLDSETNDLTISGVRVTDAANYSCTATNLVGVASATVEVLVRGAPIADLEVVVLNSTTVSLSWAHPSPLLTLTLSSYLVQFGVSGSEEREILQLDTAATAVNISQLEEAFLYEFSVFGDYGDVPGVAVTVTATTHEAKPSAAPQDVSVEGEVEALEISWLPPPEADRNGDITSYNIFYRQTDDDESDSASESRPFSLAVHHPPPEPQTRGHSARLGGLPGGRRFQVKISAVNSEGVGPNSTLVATETLEPFPLLLVLAIGVPAATILLLLCLLVCLCLCYRCCYLRSRAGKHSPLTEEGALSGQRRKKRGRERTISAPVPGIPPNIETTGGKFAMTTKQGELLSTHPKVIMPEDVATPPPEGSVVKQVPQDEVLTSLKTKHYEDPYEEVGVGSPLFNSVTSPHPLPDPPPNVRTNPLYSPDEHDGAQVWVNPQYNSPTHQSHELVAPIGNPADPNDSGSQPNISITLQGGSLPHVAHSEPMTEAQATDLRDKSQSLDLSANVWTGLPLIREAEREQSEGSEVSRGEEEGEWLREEEDGHREGYPEVEEEEFVQGKGDGWEEQLIRQDAEQGAGGETWREDATREAEQEEEEEEGEGEREEEGNGMGRKRRFTDEGWEERYIGEEGVDSLEITPAPLHQTEDELGASHNFLDLASQEEAEPVAPETEDDTEHLYAKIPESHKAKKRLKMMKRVQKEERKARKQKRKEEEREEKARRRAREKERKAREKERKKGVVKLEEDMGMGRAMRLQDIDTSTAAGHAQAQFIDAATAKFF